MANLAQTVLQPIGQKCRLVAFALIAGFARKLRFESVEARITALPAPQQTMIVGLTLALLFGFSLWAAQFGLIGLALYLLAVVTIIG